MPSWSHSLSLSGVSLIRRVLCPWVIDSITWSSFRPEPANERPCKSCVEFVLTKDYRDTFPKLSSRISWIVHWCKESEPKSPNTTVQTFILFPVNSSTLRYETLKGNYLKGHLICVVSVQRNANWSIGSGKFCDDMSLKKKTLNLALSPNKILRKAIVCALSRRGKNETVIFQ